MRKRYPSDITRKQFLRIKSILDGARKKTKPKTVDTYEVFCAILYVLKSGCQWRMLPEGFPKWSTVYFYFKIWNEKTEKKPSVLEQALKKNGWKSSYTQWSDRENKLSHR